MDGDPAELYPDGRYNHLTQIQERLNFLRFLLKDGQLWLCAPQAKQIWNCLAENAVFKEDRESCAKWFSKLMGEEPDLDPEINKDFFENNILQLDPSLITENGIKCFDRFFKAVNVKENKLVAKKTYSMEEARYDITSIKKKGLTPVRVVKVNYSVQKPNMIPVRAGLHTLMHWMNPK